MALAGIAAACALQPVRGLAQEPVRLDLAGLDGAAFVRLTDFPGRPVLINIWGDYCPGCVKETPLLVQLAKVHPEVQFLGIAVGDRLASLNFARGCHVGYPQLQAPKDPSGLLRRLGDPHGGLPFTVVLDRGHRICASRLGAVDAAWVEDALKRSLR